MTAVTYIRRENRLGKALGKPGGISFAKATEAAEANLASIRDEGVADVDRNMALLNRCAIIAAMPDSPPSARREVYAHANAIAGVAGCFGLSEVSEAAFSLCELTDGLIHADRWSADAVSVHLSAMAMLRSPDLSGGEATRRAILKGLAELGRRAPGLKDASSGAC